MTERRLYKIAHWTSVELPSCRSASDLAGIHGDDLGRLREFVRLPYGISRTKKGRALLSLERSSFHISTPFFGRNLGHNRVELHVGVLHTLAGEFRDHLIPSMQDQKESK